MQRLAHGVAGRQVGGDDDRAALAEVIEFARADPLIDIDQAGQRNHPAVLAAYIDVTNIVRPGTVSTGHLHDHVVLLAVLLEAGHLATTQHCLQRTANGLDLNTAVRGFVAVERNRKLRLVQLEVSVDVGDAGVLRDFGKDLGGQPLQFGIRG